MFLQRVPLFSGWSEAALNRLASLLQHRKFIKNEAVYQRDQPITEIYIVQSGEFDIKRPERKPAKQIIDSEFRKPKMITTGRLAAPQLFGFEEYIRGVQRHSGSVTCTSLEGGVYSILSSKFVARLTFRMREQLIQYSLALEMFRTSRQIVLESITPSVANLSPEQIDQKRKKTCMSSKDDMKYLGVRKEPNVYTREGRLHRIFESLMKETNGIAPEKYARQQQVLEQSESSKQLGIVTGPSKGDVARMMSKAWNVIREEKRDDVAKTSRCQATIEGSPELFTDDLFLNAMELQLFHKIQGFHHNKLAQKSAPSSVARGENGGVGNLWSDSNDWTDLRAALDRMTAVSGDDSSNVHNFIQLYDPRFGDILTADPDDSDSSSSSSSASTSSHAAVKFELLEKNWATAVADDDKAASDGVVAASPEPEATETDAESVRFEDMLNRVVSAYFFRESASQKALREHKDEDDNQRVRGETTPLPLMWDTHRAAATPRAVWNNSLLTTSKSAKSSARTMVKPHTPRNPTSRCLQQPTTPRTRSPRAARVMNRSTYSLANSTHTQATDSKRRTHFHDGTSKDRLVNLGEVYTSGAERARQLEAIRQSKVVKRFNQLDDSTRWRV